MTAFTILVTIIHLAVWRCAEAAIQAALRLGPDTGETHLARAENLYRGHLDYDGALAELETAAAAAEQSPNIRAEGLRQRRQGKHQEALQNLERAADLDPRNVVTLQQIAVSYSHLRRYTEAESAWKRALAVVRDDLNTKVELAGVDFTGKPTFDPASVNGFDPCHQSGHT